MKRVLVTGAGGFIGSHLVAYLKRKGYWVRGVDIKPPQFGYPHERGPDDAMWTCDLRFDWNARRAMAGGFDHVYALAAHMGGAGFVFVHKNDLDILTFNTRINLNTLAAAAHAGVKKYLFSSSACVYPEHLQTQIDSPPLKEEDAYPAAPDSEYGWEKLFAERLCLAYGMITDMEVRIARFHNIYGPRGAWRGGREKAPAALCHKVAGAKMSGNPRVEIWGDGRATRSFCYIDDCLEMLHRLMCSGYGHPLNIGTDRAVSINELANLVAAIARVDEYKLVHVPGPQGVRGRNADLSKMRNILGYEPRTSLPVGMARLYKWIEAQVEGAE